MCSHESACSDPRAASHTDAGARTHSRATTGTTDSDPDAGACSTDSRSAATRSAAAPDGDLIRVHLIRAVNVGGAKLPMAELREMATELGATDVSTYIASGNLLCTPPSAPEDFDRALEKAITDRYGYVREVISRSVDQLRVGLAAHPFEVTNPKFSYLYFLTATPEAQRVKDFESQDFGTDEFTVIGDDLHIRYVDGAGQSKLSARVIAKGLGVEGTGRNLLTVRKLIEMAGGITLVE